MAHETDLAPPWKGSLDLLLLQLLSDAPMHGHGLRGRVDELCRGTVLPTSRSLYEVLHRLQRRGHVESTWATTENRRTARYYRLTTTGREHLAVRASEWHRYVRAVGQILGDTGAKTPTSP